MEEIGKTEQPEQLTVPKKSNKWKIVAIIFIILSVCLAGFSTYLLVKDLNGGDTKCTKQTDKDSDKDKEKDKNDKEVANKPFAGKYVAVIEGAESNDNYIELFLDGTYKRSHNFCEGFYTVEGDYSVVKGESETRIEFANSFNVDTKAPFEPEFVFYVFFDSDQKVQHLDIHNPDGEYGFYDCSGATRFVKQ